MTLSGIAAVLSLVMTLGVSAQKLPVSVDPPDPTSADPVTLNVEVVASCPLPPKVVRTAFDIDVTILSIPCSFPIEFDVTFPVELGTLPAGHYTVGVHYPSGPPFPGTFGFDVLPASSDLTVSQSIGSTAGGTSVIVTVAAAHCLNQPITACPAPAITFGGVPATNVTVIDQAHFRATTPPHAAGAVQVVVNDTSFTKSSYAFRYYDPQAPLSEKFFERVLIPVVFHGPGAFGSNWVTELSLANTNSYPVEPWRPIAGRTSIDSKPVVFGSEDAPNGLFLIVPRQATPALTFHAAVRDTSRADSEWATEIPVAREAQFSNNPVELLDVPIDPRFRTMLRIYSPEASIPDSNSQVHVTVYSLDDGHVLRELFPSLVNSSDAEHPAFVSVSDLMNGLPSGRAGVQVQGPVKLWAFATVTNNVTQHVTVVSPQ